MAGSDNKSLKQIAEDKLKSGNASQLGDPVSLKAETADSEPTEQDRGTRGAQPPRKDTNSSRTSGKGSESGAKAEQALEDKSVNGKHAAEGKSGGSGGAGSHKGKGSLADAAMKNPSLLGDPVSMKAERSRSEPTEQDRGTKGTAKPQSKI